MTTTTCDFCGKKLENGYGHKTDWKIRFSLMKYTFGDPVETKATGVETFPFNGVLTVTPEFSSTNMHWCETCLADAIKRGTME